MSRSIKQGATDQSTVIRIVDSADGTPETGVVAATAGLALVYRREGGSVVALTESDLAAVNSAHSDGGMKHIDNGYYRVDLPDAAVAAGATGVLVSGTATDMVVIGSYHPLVAYDPQDAVRLGLTALPNAAADAAGGLPISDAGGLDLDVKLANTNEVTAARMAALTDWIDGGRLDLILDTIAVDVAGLDGAAMRGTDNAFLAVSAPANFSTLLINASGHVSRVTLVDTTTTNTDMRGTDNASTFDNTSDTVVLTDGSLTTAKLGTFVLAKTTNITGFNDLSAAQVNAEADTALADYDAPTNAEMVARTLAAASYATAANQTVITDHLTDIKGATWSGVTDSLEAIRDRGDAAWTTATGFSTFDPGTDTVVLRAQTHTGARIPNVTLVDTTTTNTDMRGTDGANTVAPDNASIAAILLDTGTDGVVVAPASKTGYTLSATGLDSVLAFGVPFLGYLDVIFASAAGILSGAGSGTETFKGFDKTTSRIIGTVDSLGNRTAATYDTTV